MPKQFTVWKISSIVKLITLPMYNYFEH